MEFLREQAGALWQDLRGQRTRALLTLLAVAWGTLSLLCLLAFSLGFEDLFQRRSAGIGDGVAIAWPARTTRPWQGFAAGRRVIVHREDVLALGASVPELRGVSAEFNAWIPLHQGARVLRTTLSGVDPEYGPLRSIHPRPGGRWLHGPDIAERRRVVFLGDRLAHDLFGGRDPIGATVMLQRTPFTVVGVLQPKEQDSDYQGLDEARAWVPATTWLELFGRRPVSDFVFRAGDPARQTAVTAAVVAALARRLRFDPADHRALSVWDTAEQQRMLGYIFLGFHVILGLSGAVTLLVGGIGVGHLMGFLVRRRTAEIGLKLAVGATRRTVQREVLLQTALLVLVGALLGAAAGGALIAAVARSPAAALVGTPFVTPALAAATVTLVAAVGMVAGWLPARSAARLDPVTALRS